MSYRVLALVTLLLTAAAPGLACDPTPAGSPFDGLCAVKTGACTRAPYTAILSAFPGEQKELRAATEVTEQIEIAGRPALVGRLAGQRVVLTLTGIGLVNATNTTTALLDHLDVSRIVFSGVAGSRYLIGDVVVPATWTNFLTNETSTTDPGLLADVAAVAASAPAFERCTPETKRCTDVPLDPPGPDVCVTDVPRIVVGGAGRSTDPFQGKPFPCIPGGDDVYGCAGAVRPAELIPGEDPNLDAVDMESAAVAAVATARGVPFVVLRGVSDGPGDPLGLPGFPCQFTMYYRLAAHNAAVTAEALLAMLPPTASVASARTQAEQTTTTCGFERIAGPACAGVTASRSAARLVAQGCALRARAGEAGAPHPERLTHRAATRWRRAAASLALGKHAACCRQALAGKLRAAAAAIVAPAPALPRLPVARTSR